MTEKIDWEQFERESEAGWDEYVEQLVQTTMKDPTVQGAIKAIADTMVEDLESSIIRLKPTVKEAKELEKIIDANLPAKENLQAIFAWRDKIEAKRRRAKRKSESKSKKSSKSRRRS